MRLIDTDILMQIDMHIWGILVLLICLSCQDRKDVVGLDNASIQLGRKSNMENVEGEPGGEDKAAFYAIIEEMGKSDLGQKEFELKWKRAALIAEREDRDLESMDMYLALLEEGWRYRRYKKIKEILTNLNGRHSRAVRYSICFHQVSFICSNLHQNGSSEDLDAIIQLVLNTEPVRSKYYCTEESIEYRVNYCKEEIGTSGRKDSGSQLNGFFSLLETLYGEVYGEEFCQDVWEKERKDEREKLKWMEGCKGYFSELAMVSREDPLLADKNSSVRLLEAKGKNAAQGLAILDKWVDARIAISKGKLDLVDDKYICLRDLSHIARKEQEERIKQGREKSCEMRRAHSTIGAFVEEKKELIHDSGCESDNVNSDCLPGELTKKPFEIIAID